MCRFLVVCMAYHAECGIAGARVAWRVLDVPTRTCDADSKVKRYIESTTASIVYNRGAEQRFQHRNTARVHAAAMISRDPGMGWYRAHSSRVHKYSTPYR